VSSFKNNTFGLQAVKEYRGHRDGVWEVTACGRSDVLVIGTASAGVSFLQHTAAVCCFIFCFVYVAFVKSFIFMVRFVCIVTVL